LRLAVAYDRVGLMVRHEFVDPAFVTEWHGQEITLIWKKIGPLVRDERERRGTSGYCRYIEQLKDYVEADVAFAPVDRAPNDLNRGVATVVPPCAAPEPVRLRGEREQAP
jgi:hypothetical protein